MYAESSVPVPTPAHRQRETDGQGLDERPLSKKKNIKIVNHINSKEQPGQAQSTKITIYSHYPVYTAQQ